MSDSAVGKKLVVVLGMHRSGTSAVSRGLQVMGVELGDRLMPPNPEVNAKGFWEDIDLNALNIEMLDVLGSNWHHLSPVTPADVETLHKKGYFLRAVELLRQKVGNAPVFGFKDPRVSRLLPFWKKVFVHSQFEVRYVLTVRHPISVAKSLQKRDHLDVAKSYVLWLGYAIASLTGTSGCERVIVDYDILMRSAGHELDRVADRLGLTIDQAAFQSYKTEFLDEGLRHSIYKLNDLLLDKACIPLVREVYETLLGVAAEVIEDDASLRSKVELWELELERIVPLLGLVDGLTGQIEMLGQSLTKYEHQLVELEGIVSERDGQVSTLTQAVAERDGQVSTLTEAVAERDGQISTLTEAVAERDGQVGTLTEAVAERDGQISTLTQAVAERDGQVGTLTQAVAERDGQIGTLTQAVAERDRYISELTDETVCRGQWALGLQDELTQAREQFAALANSKSWRWTVPLRRVAGIGRLAFRHPGEFMFGLIRKAYHLLPVSTLKRQQLKGWFYQRFSGIFSHTLSYSIWKDLPIGAIPKPIKVKPLPVADEFLEFPYIGNPLVSVVIPVYGQIDYTYSCLHSLWSHRSRYSFEVIVVDDCSPDNTQEVLKTIGGIRVVHNETNSGFIRSCNIGAKAANGQYVHFLNNDTQVTAGWLDELVRTFDEFPGTGLAGSKLVYPDGRLQEAGGIVWQDGSAWNFGRNQDPSLPIYNYAREVDYCSGASIMVPRELFERLGGFDEHYLPAYAEDVDLALKIRELGHRVIYQPLSVVVHFEGMTSGTDTTKGVKAYQVENIRKLYERWRSRLTQHQPPGADVDDAKDRCATRRVLVIDHCTPTPDQDAGSVIMYNMMMLLREMGFQVTFIPEDNFLYMPGYTAALQRVGIEVLYAPYVTSVGQHLKDFGGRYVLVMLTRPKVVEHHLKAVREFCPKAKVLFYTVDLHFLRMSREAELNSDKEAQKAADEMKRRELCAIQASDATIVHSTAELELLRSELPDAKLHVFPLIMNVKGMSGAFTERRDIVFVGGYQHLPNIDAVQYFVSEIMPILRKRLPGVKFHAVGSKPPKEIFELAADDVIIAGFVEDLDSLLNKMRVSVAPLRYGAGIKGKIGSAMAVGLPVVATSIALEGMALTNGENILMADDAKDFAETVASLYENEQLWLSISESSVKFADFAWGAEATWKILATILAEMGIGTKRDNRPLKLYSAKVG